MTRRQSVMLAFLVFPFTSGTAFSQDPARGSTDPRGESSATSLHDLEVRVFALGSSLHEMQGEVARTRKEASELRQELSETRELVGLLRRELDALRIQAAPFAIAKSSAIKSETSEARPQESTGERLAKIEEDQQLLNAKIDEQHQTKVESASKYPVKLSGIVLLNLFANRGAVDNQDFPTLAALQGPLASRGTVGASLRQSQVGLEIFGPEFQGAKTAADIQFDLAGGFPSIPNGVTSGVFRLRTATLRMDWSRTSVVAGQDALFISPRAPTSMASLAVPAFSYSGKLWSWAPQVRVERRHELSSGSSVILQAGVLDPLTGEPSSQYLRTPQAGEKAQPAYATRIAWSHGESDQRYSLGVGGYYSRQKYGFGRNVDGWASMVDWNLPLSQRFIVSGEFYRGRAVGGLGGGIGRSVTFNGPLANRATSVHALNSVGGWTQLKFRARDTLEFNGAVGQDSPFARDVRFFPGGQSFFYSTGLRNRTSLVNFIYRPRSDFLFSAEYRHLQTWDTRARAPYAADQVNLTMGVLF